MVFTRWEYPVNQAAMVRRAFGCFLVWWPSGRRTVRQYYAAQVERVKLRYKGAPLVFDGDLEVGHENLCATLAEFRERTHPPGWLVVTKRGRKQARRVKAVAWIHPQAYEGPAPIQGDRI